MRGNSSCWICTVDSKVASWCCNSWWGSDIYYISNFYSITFATLRRYQSYPFLIGCLSCFVSIYGRNSSRVTCSRCIPLKGMTCRYCGGNQIPHIIVTSARTFCLGLYSRRIRFSHYGHSHLLTSTFATVGCNCCPIVLSTCRYDC